MKYLVRKMMKGVLLVMLMIVSVACSDDAVGGEKVKAFEEWFVASGGVINKLEIRMFQDDFDEPLRGIAAAEDIYEGDVLLKVPPNTMIAESNLLSESYAANDSCLPSLFLHLRQSPLHETVLFLLYTRTRPASYWAPYINILPTSFDTPLTFTTRQLAELKGSSILGFTKSKLRAVQRHYEDILEGIETMPGDECRDLQQFTFDEFLWALNVIWSRAFTVPQVRHDGTVGGRQAGVVPFADMFNAAPPKDSEYATAMDVTVDATTGGLIYTAIRPIPSGEQILVRYSRNLASAQYLFDYGFIPIAENPHDVVVLTIPLPDSPLLDAKIAALQKAGFAVYGEEADLRIYRSRFPLHVIGAMRIILAESDYLLSRARENALAGKFGEAIDFANEEVVLRTLEAKLLHSLAQYPTSLNDDQKKWNAEKDASRPLSRRKKLALLLRIGEKEILRNTLSQIRQMRRDLASGVKAPHSHDM
eukprot:TRINITY_DN11669_c0_g1_i1.p1 TRINITY_DN11669_c0_g1~~TRINITY_DN11669_c0_g1_i1.p1  ORF type:complete len:476 (+),score=83.17 TRINITY_DN11669_c0_g1_i1:28-1455(+)